MKKLYFIVGSQDLYGEECLKQVAEDSRQMVAFLNEKVGDLVVEDYNLRKYLKKTLYSAGIPKIEIERDNAKIKIYLHCARPGVVIGKGGTEIWSSLPTPTHSWWLRTSPSSWRSVLHSAAP